jgi:adenylate cyclase
VTILFADLIGFTALSSKLSARDVVGLLNGLFSEFDRLALSFGVEKIKTIGDAYMLAGGVPEPRRDNAHAVADTALAMLETVKRMNYDLPTPLQMRFGMHSWRRERTGALLRAALWVSRPPPDFANPDLPTPI